MSALYQAGSLKRRRRTRAQIELREHLCPGSALEFHRVGITAEQVETYNLPTKPRKTGDRRSLHLDTAVEAEAMPASILRRILREAVEDLLPEGALAVAKAAERSERQHIERMAQFMGRTS